MFQSSWPTKVVDVVETLRCGHFSFNLGGLDAFDLCITYRFASQIVRFSGSWQIDEVDLEALAHEIRGPAGVSVGFGEPDLPFC